MAKFRKIEKIKDSPDYCFHCLGCGCDHGVWTTISNGNQAIWNFNGDIDKPTVSPSIRVNRGNNNLCHSFIKDGNIQYLGDCTHELRGKTIQLPEI